MESQTTEYKLQWADKYLPYVSGFANSQGGTLYVGINDNGDVVGIDNAKYLLENLPNKIIQATGIIPDIEILNRDDKEYIAIHIKPTDQPVSCNGKYYMRSGSTLQELNGNALTDFLLKQSHTTWDTHIVAEATLDDIDAEAVSYFVDLAVDAKRLDKNVKYESTEHILRKLKLIDKQGQFTFAALMLFGKDIEDYCISASFRIGRFGASQANLIFDDHIACPLIRMPEKVMQTLRSRYLVAPIRYEGLQRIEQLEIPDDALREIICNAIVHRDYRDTFTQMRVYDDHIELWNSGVFPPEITAENLMTSHESHPRNELIARVFYLAGFIENWGRGYEKIKESFTKSNLQVPSFEQIRGGILATIRRERFVALNKQNVGDGVGDGVGDMSVIELTERQHKIINLISENPTISATQMSVMMSVIKRTIEREIAVLRKQGIIAREGSARTGHWRIVCDKKLSEK